MSTQRSARPSTALIAAITVTVAVLVLGVVLFATTRGSSSGNAGTGDSWVDSVSQNLQVAPVVHGSTGTLGNTIVTHDVVVGTGAPAVATDTVTVQYVGASFKTGRVFDSSWSRGQAAQFALNGVIPGFAQGILGMHVGGRRVIEIPASLGYGAAGSPPAVSPNEDLTFIVDLVSVP
jgi:peptidylprolyl isomerase